jgi:hypothetical protein
MTPTVSRADRWVQVGAAVFAVGLAGLLGAVVPFFFGDGNGPTWIAVTGICGVTVGLGCALAGIVSAVRSPVPVDDPDDLYVLEGLPSRLAASGVSVEPATADPGAGNTPTSAGPSGAGESTATGETLSRPAAGPSQG